MNYLILATDKIKNISDRLDVIISGQVGTTHYTEPIYPVNPPEYPYVLLPIDERAKSVLTEEEWNNRLTEMPSEFITPIAEG